MKNFLILILICVIQNTFSQSKDDSKGNLENYKKEEGIVDDNKIYNTAGLEILLVSMEEKKHFKNF